MERKTTILVVGSLRTAGSKSASKSIAVIHPFQPFSSRHVISHFFFFFSLLINSKDPEISLTTINDLLPPPTSKQTWKHNKQRNNTKRPKLYSSFFFNPSGFGWILILKPTNSKIPLGKLIRQGCRILKIRRRRRVSSLCRRSRRRRQWAARWPEYWGDRRGMIC